MCTRTEGDPLASPWARAVSEFAQKGELGRQAARPKAQATNLEQVILLLGSLNSAQKEKMVLLDRKGCSSSGTRTARHRQIAVTITPGPPVTQDVRHSRKVPVHLHVDEILRIRFCQNTVREIDTRKESLHSGGDPRCPAARTCAPKGVPPGAQVCPRPGPAF